jgi:pimeloyl-ACP methyl ester carboxylesterase
MPEKVLLLFIHGLGGDSTTWGQFPALLQSDLALKGRFDFEFFRYPSNTVRFPWSKQSIRIQDLSRAMRTELGARFANYSDVIVVAHSMGGIVAQKYIVDELKERLKLRIKGLALFAVPTEGAQLAKWGDLISFQHRNLKQLRKESDLLEAIREDWRHLDCKNALKILAVFGGQDTVVPYINNTGDKIEYIADEDHQSIVKPQSPKSTSFLLLRNFLIETLSLDLVSADSNDSKGQETKKLALRQISKPNTVLFDAYRPESEPYYVVRREDAVVEEYVSRQNG